MQIKEKKKIEEVAEKYDLELLLLFGSQVTGRTHPESDFDVAYLSKKDLDFNKKVQLDVDLMPIFHSDKVDISDIRKAPPLLLKQIFQNHQILFCGNMKKYYLYKIYAAKKYAEAKPLFELRDIAIKRFVEKHK